MSSKLVKPAAPAAPSHAAKSRRASPCRAHAGRTKKARIRAGSVAGSSRASSRVRAWSPPCSVRRLLHLRRRVVAGAQPARRLLDVGAEPGDVGGGRGAEAELGHGGVGAGDTQSLGPPYSVTRPTPGPPGAPPTRVGGPSPFAES